MIILLCLSLFLFLSRKKERTIAGVMLGIGYMVKLFPILLVLFFVLKRQWRSLFGVALASIVLAIITVITVDLYVIGYFLTHTLPGLTGGWKTDYYNQALSGLLARHVADLSLGHTLRVLISGVLVLITGFLFLKRNSKKMEIRSLQIGIVVTLNLLINTFSWQHHYVWLLIPLLTTFFFFRTMCFGYTIFCLW